jgi:carbon storage regulator
MLVLSRHVFERIRIGDSIILTVVKIQDGKVRLGIEAPPEVHIARDELPPKESGAGRGLRPA